MRNQPDTRARRAAGLLAAIAACTCVAVSGCGGGATAGSSGPSTAGGASNPAAAPSSAPSAPGGAGSVHLTGNLCADAAAMNSDIRGIIPKLVANPSGRQQQARKLIANLAMTVTALESEAPGQLKGAFAKIAGFYQAVENKLASGGRLTLADVEPTAHPGVAPAVQQISSYFATHCGA
jgi:hypothetical protein